MSPIFSANRLVILASLALAPSPVFARVVAMPVSACMPDGSSAREALKRMPVANTALQLDGPRRQPSSAELRLVRRSSELDRLIQTSICIGC